MTEAKKTDVKKLTKDQQKKLDEAQAAKLLLADNLKAQNAAYAAKGFNLQAMLSVSAQEQAVSLVYGKDDDGVDCERVLLWILPQGCWQLANADGADKVAIEAAGVLDEIELPRFAHVYDGKNEKYFELGFPPHEVDQIPGVNEIKERSKIKRDCST
jgi:type I restriction enzyme M protein